MTKTNILYDLTWESKSYEDGEKRDFSNKYGLIGSGELKGDVLEFNFNNFTVLNHKRRSVSVIHKMLEAPKEIGVVIKIDGKVMYLKEKNTGVIGETINCRDIKGLFVYLRYADIFYSDVFFKDYDGKFFINYKNDKLQEISIADKFHLTIDDAVTESRKDSSKFYEIKKVYKIEVSDFMTAYEVYGQLIKYYISRKLDPKDLEILEKMLRDEIKEKLPEIIFEDEDFKEFANLKDRTPENLFAVQKLYKYVPNLNFEETVNMLETIDDATFEFWLCGLGNEINVRYSKKGINFYVKEKINFEKMIELFKVIEPLRKYGRISISTDDRKLHLEETDEEIVFHKGRKSMKDLKLLEKFGKFNKKVELLINGGEKFVINATIK